MNHLRAGKQRVNLRIKFLPLMGLLFMTTWGPLPVWAEDESKFSVTPYGRIELDAITSDRNTNPLDPANFNGYSTAAGSNSNSSSTFSPRWTVMGLRANRTSESQNLTGIVEFDFFGDSSGGGSSTIAPRLRLANVTYATGGASLTVGQDWLPVMALLTDNLDFSILGYGGNLWQRLPQVTLRYKFSEGLEGLITAFRNERGFICCQRGTQAAVGANNAAPGSDNAFNEPRQMPYVGIRLAHTHKDGLLLAISGAYRSYRSGPFIPAVPELNVTSYLVGGEVVVPLGPVTFSGEVAYGQGLGDEFFRFGQERSGITGNPIRTLTAWGQLSFSPSKAFTFLAGYGVDNPRNGDLANVNAVDAQYLLNHRTYLTVIHPIWGGFNVALEWNHLMTEWASTSPGSNHFQGNNYMVSFWYGF